MGTNLTYNGVVMTNVQTLEFKDKEPVRDPSGTDKWYDETTIRVRTFLNTSTIGGGYVPGGGGGAAGNIGITSFPGSAAGMTPQAAENIIAGLLNQERQVLHYTMQGVTMVSADITSDVNNGPKPFDVSVTKFSPGTLMIEFGVKVALVQCPDFVPSSGKPTPGNAVLSNRWACVDDLDDRFITTRIWQGILRVAGANFHPNDFRDMTVPPLFAGWKREHMHFQADPDGLTLGYAVVDREMAGPAPPWPGARMEFTHVETCGEGEVNVNTGAGPITGQGTCHVIMEGGRGADKRLMICRAANIIEQKLQLGPRQQTFRILEMTVADHQSADVNRIEMQAKVQHYPLSQSDTAGAGVAFINNIVMAQIGLPLSIPAANPGTGVTDAGNQGNAGSSNTGSTAQANANTQAMTNYNPDQAWCLGSYGSATLSTAFAAFLQSPCSPDGTHTTSGGYSNPTSPSYSQPTTGGTNETPSVTYSTGPVSTTAALSNPPVYAGDGTQSIFQYNQIDSQLVKNFNRVALPIASGPPAEGDTLRSTVAVFALAPPTAKRIVRITAECKNNWPTMPQDVDFIDRNGIQNFILGSKILSKARTPTPDGNGFDYSQAIEYVYALSRPPAPDESLPVGILQWDGASTKSTNSVPSSAFIEPTDSSYGID